MAEQEAHRRKGSGVSEGMEGWRDGGMEGWRDGGMEGWSNKGEEQREE